MFGINLQDELSMFLMWHGLKPAAIVTLDPLECNGKYGVLHTDDRIIIDPREQGFKFGSLWTENRDVFYMKGVFERFGFDFFPAHMWKDSHHHGKPFYSADGKPVSVRRSSWFVSPHEYRVEQYKKARTTKEKIHALAHPVNEIANVNGNLKQIMQRSVQDGFTIPMWAAYLAYVPHQLLMVKESRFRSQSKQDGTKFQRHTHRLNPQLAERVETNFRERYLG